MCSTDSGVMGAEASISAETEALTKHGESIVSICRFVVINKLTLNLADYFTESFLRLLYLRKRPKAIAGRESKNITLLTTYILHTSVLILTQPLC